MHFCATSHTYHPFLTLSHRNEVLRLRFEVDYLSRGGDGPGGPDDEEEEDQELEEKQLQLHEAEAALKVC